MEKDMTSQQAQDTDSGSNSLLPYTAPELFVYNQAKITLGGIVTKGVDAIGPFTNYKVS